MSLFSKVKKRSGWLAIGFYTDVVCAVCIKRIPTHKPKVRICTSFPGKRGDCSDALEKIVKDFQGNRYFCTSVLSGGDYQIMSVETPNVPPAELKGALRWRLKDLLDYPVEQATFDLLPIPQDSPNAERNASLFAIAAHNKSIEAHQNMFLQANIGLSVIDIPEMAQRNVSSLIETEGTGLAMLSFDQDGGLLTVTYGGNLYLSRRIDVNLQQLELARSEEREAAYDKVTLELQRSLDHFDRQYHHINLTKLVLAPMGEEGDHLHNYLASNMYLPVESLDLLDVLDFSKVPEMKDKYLQHRFFLTLGAALRQEEHAS